MAQAHVKWRLSTDFHQLPEKVKASGGKTYRALMIDGDEFEFSGGFDELHRRSYEEILVGKGYGVENVARTIDLVRDFRRWMEDFIFGSSKKTLAIKTLLWKIWNVIPYFSISLNDNTERNT